MKVKKLIAAVAVVGTGFAVFTTGATVQAEPVSNSYVVVGSDTIEDVLNALANGTAITGSTVRVTQNGATLGSFDATGGPSVITKPGGVRFSRPNGSSEGFRALSASIYEGATADNNLFTSGTFQPALNAASTGGASMPLGLRNINIFGQVDIARSSSGTPASAVLNDATGTIARIPFARDAFGLAFTPALATAVCNAGQDSDAGAGCVPFLTNAQLKSIFESTTSGGGSVTIGSTAVTIKGVMPQKGSGTRTDFVSKIGTTDTLSDASVAAGASRLEQEHDASTLTGVEVAPMSASRWIAMKNGASFDRGGTAVLGGISTDGTVPASPVLGTAPALTPNSTYYANSTWGRDCFLFVERARVTVGNAKYDANLAALVDPTLNKLANIETNGASKAGKVKELFGLLAPLTATVSYYDPKYAGWVGPRS